MKQALSVAAIVQARMGSTRLPGKSIAKVYRSYSLLELVLLRVKAARKLDRIILATSENNNCDPLAEIAKNIGIAAVRGSETDVLSRFVHAINAYNPDIVVRVCADNPLISFEEIDKLISFFMSNDLDYAANNTPQCGLPDGLGAEIIRADFLKRISQWTQDPSDREHVTQYLLDNPGDFKTGLLRADPHLCFPEAKLDIDTPEDLERMRVFCKKLPEINTPYWTSGDIVRCLKETTMQANSAS